jgi:hypothetical protein
MWFAAIYVLQVMKIAKIIILATKLNSHSKNQSFSLRANPVMFKIIYYNFFAFFCSIFIELK